MVRFFLGHIVPGTLFLLLGLRWAIATAYDYSLWRVSRFHKRHRKEHDYRNTVTMNLPCNLFWLRNHLVESYLKLIGALYGVCFHFFETVDETDKAIKGEVEYNGDFGDTWSIMYRAKHHYIIYAIFAISAAVELMTHYGIKLPDKSDRALFIISFAVEAFMFSFHFHGRGNIDVQLHILQTCAIYCTLICCVLEACNERQVLYAYGRALFVTIQGSWFYQNAFTLYYPYSWPDFKWDLKDHRLVANITFYFCKHFIGALIALILLHLLIQWIVTGSWRGEVPEETSSSSSRGGKRIRFNYHDEDDETECIRISDAGFSDQEDLLEKSRHHHNSAVSHRPPKVGENTFSDFVNTNQESFTAKS